MENDLGVTPSDFTYNLCNTAIEGVRFHTEQLGVYITCALHWSRQCEEVQKKANRVLAVLQCNILSAPTPPPPPPKLKNVHIRLLYAPSLSMHMQFEVLTLQRELQLLSRFKGVRPDLCLMTIRDLQVCFRPLINEL